MQEIYTSDQVAKILQVHPQTVLKFIREGKLRGSKVGRGYRVKASDIEKFLEDSAEQPNVKSTKKEESKKQVPSPKVEREPEHFKIEETHYFLQ